MVIMHVVSSLDIGGINSLIVDICNELNNQHSFYIGVYQGDVTKRKIPNLSSNIKIVGFNTINEYISIVNQYKIEIVHFHIMLKSGIFEFLTKLRTKAKTVCHSHSSTDFRTDFIYLKIYKPLSKFLIKYFTDCKIACSDVAGQYLYKRNYIVLYNAIDTDKFNFNEEYRNCVRDKYKINSFTFGSDVAGQYLYKRNYIVLYNAIDTDKFNFNEEYRNCVRDKYKINSFTFGFVGHIHSIKNLEFICSVLNDIYKIIKFNFLIVGDYTESKALYDRINTYDFVTITGMVEDSFKYYSSFDCFLLPSLSEGMPLVAVEAQANGLDVYLSDVITQQVNVDNHCHYLKLNDYDMWKKALITVLRSNQRSSLNYCTNSQFDISLYSKKLNDIYNHLAK